MTAALTDTEIAAICAPLTQGAAQLSASLADASSLLQHSSPAVTRAHYRRGHKLRR